MRHLGILSPGGTIQTGTGVATPADPTTTAVTTPAGRRQFPSTSRPVGHRRLVMGSSARPIAITAPAGDVNNPIRITFRIDPVGGAGGVRPVDARDLPQRGARA